jgi:hypothetical protein
MPILVERITAEVLPIYEGRVDGFLSIYALVSAGTDDYFEAPGYIAFMVILKGEIEDLTVPNKIGVNHKESYTELNISME